jgi:hypothetical protein
LAEGGYDLMRDGAFLARLASAKTRHVLLVCGSPSCFRTAQTLTRNVSRARLAVSVAGDPLSGHNLNERMQDALRRAWPSLVSDLPEWRGFSR